MFAVPTGKLDMLCMHAILLTALLLNANCADVLASPASYWHPSPSPTPNPKLRPGDIGKSWPDRRPMGRIIFAQVAKISDTNLNGWDNGGPNALGVSAFQQNILSWVNTAIGNVIRMHGQGIIIWDITGCGKTTLPLVNEAYLGDPRFLDARGAGLTSATAYSPYVR